MTAQSFLYIITFIIFLQISYYHVYLIWSLLFYLRFLMPPLPSFRPEFTMSIDFDDRMFHDFQLILSNFVFGSPFSSVETGIYRKKGQPKTKFDRINWKPWNILSSKSINMVNCGLTPSQQLSLSLSYTLVSFYPSLSLFFFFFPLPLSLSLSYIHTLSHTLHHPLTCITSHLIYFSLYFQAAKQGADETARITTFTVNGLAAAISTG